MKQERTREEREQARLEREAKRAARQGRPPPAALAPTELPPEEPTAPAPEPAPEPLQAEAEPVLEPVEPEPEPIPEPIQPAPEPAPATPPSQPVPISYPPVSGAEPELRRGRGRRRQRDADSGVPIRPPKPPPPYQPTLATAEARNAAAQGVLDRRREAGEGAPRGRRRIGVGLGVLLAILAALVIAVGWFALSLFQPFKGDGSSPVPVNISQGESVGAIADDLERKGVISSAFFFEARATVAGRRDDFKAGNFSLKEGMSHTAAMDVISKGPPPDVTQVAIPEGRARRQVAALVPSKLPGDYMALTRRSKTFDTRRYGAPRGATLEGFLFPATYELKKGSRVSGLVDQQLGLFKRNFARVDLTAAKRRKLTAYDVLTIASMIDQEAQLAKERPIIASVIYNRLREGIPLGIDATIRFATNNRTKPLTQSQLAINSPYNTRTRRGLPPGPIGSPGLASIKAAAKPASTKFLYYVVKPNTCGEHVFSRTDAEFQRDAERYNSERAKRGGKSPTRC